MNGMSLGGLTPFIQQQRQVPVNGMAPQDNQLEKILLGLSDARGPMGQAARGTNVYRGATGAPNTGISYGDLSKSAMQRRLKENRARAQGKPVIADMPRGGLY